VTIGAEKDNYQLASAVTGRCRCGQKKPHSREIRRSEITVFDLFFLQAAQEARQFINVDIWLLTDAVAAMRDPLPTAVGTGDQFVKIILLNVLGNADKAGSWIGNMPPKSSHPDRRATLGAALIERAAFWYQLLVLKSTTWRTVLRLRTLLETDRFTTRLAL
jgi:hypothetical protein